MRRFVLVAIAFAIAVPVAFLVPARASAATCSGYGCDGVDAIGSGCSTTAYTAEQVNVYDPHVSGIKLGYVQLRYSPSCRTVWAKTVNLSGTWQSATVTRNSNGFQEYCSGGGYSSIYGGTVCQTAMIYDANVTSYAQGLLEDTLGYFVTSAKTASF